MVLDGSMGPRFADLPPQIRFHTQLFRGSMNSRLAQRCRRALLPLVALAGVVLSNCGPDGSEPTSPSSAAPNTPSAPASSLSLAVAAQARHSDQLLRIPGVVGTAVAVEVNGRAGVRLFTRSRDVRGLPATLDGVPVSTVVTGAIRALPAAPSLGVAAAALNRRSKFARPVPIGISTGNQGECL